MSPERPNTRVKPTREAGSAWTTCYARQGKPEASGPQRVGESREQGQSHRQPGTGRGQQEPKPTATPVRKPEGHPEAVRRESDVPEAE